MPTYNPDGVALEPPDANAVRARVTAQDSILSGVEDDLVGIVQSRVSSQEQSLRSVYRPARVSVTNRVTDNGQRLQGVADVLARDVVTRLGTQSARLGGITSLTPTSPPIAPESPPPPPPEVIVGDGPPPGDPCSVPLAPADLNVIGAVGSWTWVGVGPLGPVTGVSYLFPNGTVYHYRYSDSGCIVPTVPPPPPPIGTPPPPPPPIGTPPPPPPPIGDPTICEPTPPTTHSVEYLPWQWLTTHWFSYVCRVGCPIEIHHYVTPTRDPPTGVVGTLVGPYDVAPSRDEIIRRVRESECLAPDSEVPVPPPPPPGVPPTVPPTVPPPPPPPGVPPVVSPPTVPPLEILPGACWGGSDICKVADAIIQDTSVYVPPDKRNTLGSQTVKSFAETLADGIATIGGVGAWAVSGFDDDEYYAAKDELSQGWLETLLGASVATKTADKMSFSCIPHPEVFAAAAPILASTAWATRISGVPTDYITQSITYAIQAANPQYIPAQGEIDSQYLANQITSKEWECYTRANGNHPLPFMRTIRARQATADIFQVTTLYLRGYLTLDQYNTRLRELGVLDTARANEYRTLAEFVPPPSDLIRMSVKEVFDPNDPDKPDTRREYDENQGLKELLAAQGMGPFTITTNTGERKVYDTGYMYWHAHYDDPSPTQSYQFYQQLRPGRLHLYPLKNEDGTTSYPQPFGLKELRRLLKDKDYTPRFRDRLAAIAFRPLGRIDCKNLYKRKAFGPPLGLKGFDLTRPGDPIPTGVAEIELRERFMDMGYSEPNANHQAYDAAAAFDQSSLAKGRARTRAIVCKQLGIGTITGITAVDTLEKIGYTRDEGWQEVNQCRAEHAVRDFTIGVSAVKRQFVSGVIAGATARQRLTQLGAIPQRVDQYMRTWELLKEKHPRDVQASQILDWYNWRIIDSKTAVERLVNLNFTEDDARRMVRRVELGEAAKSSKELEKQARAQQRAREKLQTQAERRLRESQQAQERALAKRLAAWSEKNIKDWWTKGLVTTQDIIGALSLKGWGEQEISRWMAANQPEDQGDDVP